MYRPDTSLTGHITQCAVTESHYSPPPLPADSSNPIQACIPYDHLSFKYGVDDILQIILKSRKNWKTLRGQSEAVWPPYLEATMLKALQEYEPDDSRETRILGRYPMRNRFISDYIHNTTGKYRSAKQVGSRLQQLRDTPEGRELIDVLTRCYHTRMDTGTCNARVPVCQPTSWTTSSSTPPPSISCNSSSSSSSSSSPVPSVIPVMSRFIQPRTRQPPESRMPVCIDILPSMGLNYSSTATPSSASDLRPSDAARHIHNIDPTVTFVSPSPVNGKSSYIVLLDGAPVHSEDTTLEYVGPYFSSSVGQPHGDQPMLYNTALVPKYWDVICDAADPTLYTIVQDVYCVPNPVPNNQDYSQRPRPARIFSAIYHFQYPTSSVGAAPVCPQISVDASHGSSSMTSVFDNRTLQGSIPDLTYATPFSMPSTSTYTTTTGSEGFQTPIDVDQNLFDEPFMLDVNFEHIAFDDFAAHMGQSALEGAAAHFFPRDPNTYFM